MQSDVRKSISTLLEESEQFEQRCDELRGAPPEAASPGQAEFIAQVRDWMQTGRAQGRYLPSGSADRRALRSLLERWKSRLRDLGEEIDGADTVADFDPAAGSPLTVPCPYPGLQPYLGGDRASFFGREAFVSDCVDHLEGPGNRILLIVGASGAGKSSVAMAGVLPALVERHADWSVAPRFTPGANPLKELAAAVAAVTHSEAGDAPLFEQLSANPTSARAQLAAVCTARPLVLFIDQFEEVLTMVRDASDQQRFAQALESLTEPSAAEESGFACRVLVTLRTDHLARLESAEAFKGLYSRLVAEGNQRYLAGIRFEDIRRAIKDPADRVGLRFVPASLVDQLASQTAGLSSGLPLLQYGLRRLWETRPVNAKGERLDLITSEMVEQLPDVERALGTVADDVFRDFTAAQQRVCERLILELLVLDESFEEPLRRRRFEAEVAKVLESGGAASGDIAHVIERFTSAGLLRRFNDAHDSQIEVSHEALLRHWSRIYRLLSGSEVKERLHLIKQIGREAAEWAAHGRSEDYLNLRGERLASAWRLHQDGWLAEGEGRPYVEACRTDEQAKEDRDRKALDERRRTAARLAAERAGRQRLYLAAALVALLVAGTVSYSSNLQQREAARLSLKLAEEQQDPHAAVAFVADALRHDPQAWSVAKVLVGNIGRYSTLAAQRLTHQGAVYSAVFSPDDRYVVTTSEDKTARIWQVRTGGKSDREIRGDSVPKLEHQQAVTYAEFSRDGRYLVTASRDGAARVWSRDANTGVITAEPWMPPVVTVSAPMNAARFSPKGELLVTVKDRRAQVWDVDHRALLGEVTQDAAVQDASFSPDGRFVAVRSLDGSAVVFEPLQVDSTQHRLDPIDSGQLKTLGFSPSGSFLLAVSVQGTAKIWDSDLVDRKKLGTNANGSSAPDVEGPPHSPAAPILAAAFSPDDKWLVTADASGWLSAWNAKDEFQMTPLMVVPGARVVNLEFVPTPSDAGGSTFFAVASDGTVRVYQLHGDQNPVAVDGAMLFHRDAVRGVSASHDGSILATSSIDGLARLWTLRSPSSQQPDTVTADARPDRGTEPPGADETVLSVDFSNGQRKALAVGSRHRLSLLSPDSKSGPLKEEPLREGQTDVVRFSRDGSWLISTSTGHTPNTKATIQVEIRDVRIPGASKLDATIALPDPMSCQEPLDGCVISAAYSPETAMWAVGSRYGVIQIGKGTNRLAECRHAGPVSSLEFSKDGTKLLSASYDGTAKVWALQSNRCHDELSLAHSVALNRATFSRNDRWILTASQAGARLWSAEGKDAGAMVHLLDRDRPIDDAIFSDDDSLAVTTSVGDTQIWDVGTGGRLAQSLRGNRNRPEQGLQLRTRVWLASDKSEVATTDEPVLGSGPSPMSSARFSVRRFDLSPGGAPRSGLPVLMRAFRWTFWPNNEWAEASNLLESVAGLELDDQTQRLLPVERQGGPLMRFEPRARESKDDNTLQSLAAFLLSPM